MDLSAKNSNEEETHEETKNKTSLEFKKPVLIGKIGKLPRKVVKPDAEEPESHSSESTERVQPVTPIQETKEESKVYKKSNVDHLSPAELLKEQLPIPYKEPKWSGLPPYGSGYRFEVLKSGIIIETIDLCDKAFHVFGRLAGCDVVMAHPTISRYHAVLQYKARDTDDERPKGFYVYDLGSSHGTIVNKKPVKANHYVRLQVGHMVKLGCSTRLYILQGPDTDQEEESALSLTEMKELRKLKKEQFEKEMMLAKLQKEKEDEEREKKIEQEGISWGMDDDADEETDLSENPYAQSTNEELYLDDPKKTLRGFFEREGCTLEYDCQERGIGQFVCRVELPIEDARGNSVIAEVLHKGKKKDAVIQCALEACRIIDRHGLLRQAKHESRKRKTKNWKDDDYYDSDDDTYLDRTGVIEKKRERRMKEFEGDFGCSSNNSNSSKQSGKALTYNELVDKCKDLQLKLAENDKKLSTLREQSKSKIQKDDSNDDDDALDQFMSNLGKQSVSNKAEISQTKLVIQKIKMELEKTEKLAELAKPVNLPPLIPTIAPKSTIIKKDADTIFIGKKITKQTKKEVKHPKNDNASEQSDKFVVEMDSDDESTDNTSKKETMETSSTDNVKLLAIKKITKTHDNKQKDVKKLFGPMRPPSNYVVPDGYYDQENDRDLPEIMEENE